MIRFSKIIFGLMLVIIVCSGVSAQDNPEWIVYNKTNTNSGLPVNNVTSIIIDSTGLKWIGTQGGGFIKFDGSKWKTYIPSNSYLPSENINSISLDDHNNKWIATDKGLAVFNGSKWTVYNSNNTGMTDNDISAVRFDSQGFKWVGMLPTWWRDSIYVRGGMAEFNDTNWTVFNTDNSGMPSNWIISLAIDRLDNKWLGADGSVTRYNGNDWTVYNYTNSPLSSTNVVYAIAIDEQDNKWICTRYGGLMKFDGINWKTYSMYDSGIPDNDVWCITIDSHNVKWIGTRAGIVRFDGTKWLVYNTSNSFLPSNLITSIAVDKYDNKWIATAGGGLAVFKEGGISFGVKEVNNNLIAVNISSEQNITTVTYELKNNSDVKIQILDINGRLIKTLDNSKKTKGVYNISFDNSVINSGLYLCRLMMNDNVMTEKFCVIK